MAKQHLSPHQQGIVKRYYEHLDTLTLQKLGELVSDLYVCADPKKAAALWKRAEQALSRAGVPAARVAEVVQGRSVERLAALVGELSGPRGPGRRGP